MSVSRCKWTTNIKDEEYIAYHDEEWGTPLTADRDLFELLCLEGAQAGLSWQTILKKRKNYRLSFDNFDIAKIVKFTDARVNTILASGGVVKHIGKIQSVVANAKATQVLLTEFKSLHRYFTSQLEGVDIADPAVTQVYVTFPAYRHLCM